MEKRRMEGGYAAKNCNSTRDSRENSPQNAREVPGIGRGIPEVPFPLCWTRPPR